MSLWREGESGTFCVVCRRAGTRDWSRDCSDLPPASGLVCTACSAGPCSPDGGVDSVSISSSSSASSVRMARRASDRPTLALAPRSRSRAVGRCVGPGKLWPKSASVREVCLVTFLVVSNCPAPNVRPWTGRFHPAGQTSTLVCTFIFLRKDSGTRTGAEANTCKR